MSFWPVTEPCRPYAMPIAGGGPDRWAGLVGRHFDPKQDIRLLLLLTSSGVLFEPVQCRQLSLGLKEHEAARIHPIDRKRSALFVLGTRAAGAKSASNRLSWRDVRFR